MYLALLLSPESEAELRRFAPDAPVDLHLTIIHSKTDIRQAAAATRVHNLGEQPQTISAGLPLPSVALPIIGQGVSTDWFGPPTKRVKVLKICSDPFWELRRQAEAILRTRYIPWSTQWNFSPHLTLGKSGYSGSLPITLTFDRLEWR